MKRTDNLNRYSFPIPSREEILGILRSTSGKHNAKSIAKALHVKKNEMDSLMKRLEAMERDGQIKADSSGRYQMAKFTGFVVGQVSAHPDGYGFLVPDEGGDDIFLPEKEMQKVLNADRVQVRIVGSDRRGRPEGTIVEVLSRANTHVIGRLINENGVWLIAPEDKRIVHDVLIEGGPGKAKAGQIVSAEIVSQPTRYTQPVGKIAEVLGSMDDPGIEIEIAVRKFGLPHVFSQAALQQAERLPSTVQPEDLAGRVDLRDIPLVTIDGEDARDFDDAVYCEPVMAGRKNAGFRMIVAIADVSHYVKPNDPLDKDALQRATSVYFPRRVIPMLPEKLSNGLCSLNPNVDRLTLVCDAVISAEGEITAYQFYPAVMHSAARLTYTEVAAILKNPKGPEAIMRAKLVPHIQNLYALYHVLFDARQRRGAIDFETVETYIISNAAGKIEKIVPRVRNDAHRLIEECMLAANVCAADLLERHDHPGTYRIHASPSKEKLDQIRTFLAQIGLSLGGGDSPKPSDYAELLEKVKQRPDAPLLQTMLLRSMQQAVYSPDNIGHFGLAYEAYTHFTSPIRRYPDLLTHRAIKAILQGGRYEPKGIDKRLLNTVMPSSMKKQKERAEEKRKPDAEQTIWDALGLHCSVNERRADEASRDVEAWLKCYFIRDKLGEHFTGTISGVAPFGIFVQLDDIFIEGMVHITELGADYFHFDESRHELRGERSGVRYQLTDRVTVQVSRVDLDARRIDLALVSGPAKAAQAGAPTPVFDRFKKRAIAGVSEREGALHGTPVSVGGRRVGTVYSTPAAGKNKPAQKVKSKSNDKRRKK